jgi:hypothetical protein
VTYEKDHPYVPNNDEGRQVTFRIADLTNPILKPWAIEKMREQNELAAAGKRAYEARASCRPGGVPGFLVMGRVNPLYFVQAKNEVSLSTRADRKCAASSSTSRIRRIRR